MTIYSNVKYITELMLYDNTYPGAVLIIRSGWKDMFHVITENPEDGDHDHTHEFLSRDKVIMRYGIDLLGYTFAHKEETS
jgi:hypothetical protein